MSLRLALIAPLRFPIRLPFAGGLESAVWNEVRHLRARGHHVELIATEGSDFLDLGPASYTLPAVDWRGDPSAADDTYPPGYLDRALPALDRALDEVRRRSGSLDVVVNHCLHGLPLARAGSLGVPMISTLHTPVVPELVASHGRAVGQSSRFLSVSGHTARTWRGVGIASDVLHNGVDEQTWVEGPGGDSLVWSGRIVPEKAPHLALRVAHLLGRPLTIAGRIGDRAYFDAEIQPLLDDDRCYVGPLGTADLVALVGRSSCALVTPLWDEPFGLVTPEALLCGTPVAGFAVGGVTELHHDSGGLRLVPVGDVEALAGAVSALVDAGRTDPGFRRGVRDAAVGRFGLTGRIRELERVLERTAAEAEPAA